MYKRQEQGLATAEGELAQLAEQEAGLEEQKLILETLGNSITPEQQAALDAINSSLAELAPAKAALEEQVSQLEGQLEQMLSLIHISQARWSWRVRSASKNRRHSFGKNLER